MTKKVLARKGLTFLGNGVSCLGLVALATTLWSAFASSVVFGQEQSKPLIKIVATGGTISNTLDGRIPIQQTISDIRKNFPETLEFLDSVRIEVVDIIRLGSSRFTSKEFLGIARAVNKAIQESEVKGVIVTHGTVTTEETAYFLQLLVKSNKPVVITNSQRRHGTLGNDGDKNLIDSISVVLSPEAVGKGVMVVHNQTISSGREVLKTSGHPGSFLSAMYGVLGIVESDRVIFYRAPTRRHTSNSEFDIDAITALPKVEVISAYYDADPALIQAAADLGVEGIVLNGLTTSGGPHVVQRPVLERLADQGMPIVRTARGGMNNRVTVNPQDKFIEGDNLIAHKARILLQLALTKTSDLKEIQRMFNEY